MIGQTNRQQRLQLYRLRLYYSCIRCCNQVLGYSARIGLDCGDGLASWISNLRGLNFLIIITKLSVYINTVYDNLPLLMDLYV